MRGIIAGLVIVVIVAVVAFSARSPQPTGPVNGENPKASGGAPAGGLQSGVLAPVAIVLECETATTIELKADDGREVMKIREHNEGQRIGFIDIPEKAVEDWISACCSADPKKNPADLKSTAGALPGKATYAFQVPRDDTYYINLRAKWDDDCGNSVWVKVDDQPYREIESQNGKIADKNYKWAWHQLMETGRPKGIKLSAGPHVLHMSVREDGPWLDQWFVTTDATTPIGDTVKK